MWYWLLARRVMTGSIHLSWIRITTIESFRVEISKPHSMRRGDKPWPSAYRPC